MTQRALFPVSWQLQVVQKIRDSLHVILAFQSLVSITAFRPGMEGLDESKGEGGHVDYVVTSIYSLVSERQGKHQA